MSQNLKDIDLSTVSGEFTLDTRGTPFQSCGWLEFINASPYTLYVQMGGYNFKCPAWYHMPVQLQVKNGPYWQSINGANFPCKITPSLLGASTTNLSTMLLPVLYMTGETPATTTPQPLAHQTYIPNNVNTVGTNTLSNEGNPANTLVIDIGDVNISELIKLFTDHFSIAVDQAGVKHVVLQGQTSGNPLVVGQAGDNTEVAGNLAIDQILTWIHTLSAGNQLINLLQSYGLWSDNVGTLGLNRIWIDGPDRGEFHIGPRSGANFFDWIRFRTTQLRIELGANTSPNSELFQVSGGPTQLDGGNIATDGNGGVTLYKSGVQYAQLVNNANGASIDVPTGQNFTLSINGTSIAYANHVTGNLKVTQGLDLVVGGVARMFGQDAVACGSGTTISHGMGITPDVIVATPEGSQSYSATVGVGNIGSSTFRATVGAGAAIDWLGWNI